MVQTLIGSSLIIKGKTVVTGNADVSCNALNASQIRVPHGGVNITGKCSIQGDLNVKGTLTSDVVSNIAKTILNNTRRCMVSLLFYSQTGTYYSCTGCFISSDGWVLSCAIECSSMSVWGTMYINGVLTTLKASQYHVDSINGICIIKFPELLNQPCLDNVQQGSDEVGTDVYVVKGAIEYFDTSVCRGIIHSNDPVLLVDNVVSAKFGDVIVDSYGRLLGICNIINEYGLIGGPNIETITKSVLFMQQNKKDIHKLQWLGIDKWYYVNTYEIITSGLYGAFEPKGIMIDSLNEQSNINLPRGTIITHIDGNEIGLYTQKFNENTQKFLQNEQSDVQIKYILPPQTEILIKNVKTIPFLDSQSNKIYNFEKLVPLLEEKSRFVEDYHIINNKNAQKNYEMTHQEEIKRLKREHYQKKILYMKERRGIK